MPNWKTIVLPASLLLAVAGYLTGQIPTFQKTYGGSGTEVGYHIIEVAGGYLVAGSTSSFGSGGVDACLVRLDENGNVLWQRTYGGANDDEFTLVTTANDGGFLALGSTRSQGQGGKDILLVKTDNNGQVVWSKTIGGSVNDNAAIAGEIMKFPNGYLISGQQYSVDFSSGGAAYFIRLNNSGTAVWSRAYTTSNGNNLVSTYVEGNTIYVGGGATDNANGGACFMKLNATNGNIIQSKMFSGDYNETIYNIRPTQDGNLLLSDGTWSATNNQFHRQWVVKATKDGSVLWSKIYALPGANSRGLAIEMPDGGILLSPYTFPLSNLSNGNLIKTDANGTIQWAYRYGGAGGDFFYKAFPTSDGGIIAIGATQGANGNQDMFVVKTDGAGRIAGCCPQVLDVTAQDYALPEFDVDIGVSAFPTPQGWNIPSLSSSPVSADFFCTTPQPEVTHVVTLTQNEVYAIGGVPYTAPDTVEVSVPGPGGCDTLVTYILQLQTNAISGIVNDYTPVLSFAGCDSSVLQVGSAAAFSPNDKILIIQMKGATVNLTNTSAFGNIISPGNAGNYEFNRIKSISGNEITLLYKLTRSYDVGGKVQLIRVPEYGDATVDGLTCKPWDGATGGVLAIDVAGVLTLQGAGIDVSARGFRGGVVVNANDPAYHQTGYFFPPDANLAAQKGEGIAEIALNQSYGCGKAANGGGGGNAHNAGGGGGGNAGAGGNGGLEYYNTPFSPTPNTNGLGGASAILNSPPRIIMGGGGGAGHANDQVGSSGGNGGGIAILRAATIAGNNNRIAANGENIFGPGGTNSNDGQGGGGAGGTIVLDASQIASHVDLEVKGGRGGDCLFYVNSQIIGPGGGGGGGRILSAQLPSNMSFFLNGGQNGIANQNLTNDAQPGGPGLFGAVFPTPVFYEDTIPAGVISIAQDVVFCPGSFVTIDGVDYNQPGTVVDTIPGTAGCDTIVTYHLQFDPLDLVFNIEDIRCENGQVNMQYSLCNLGSGPFPDFVDVTFYDADPTAGPANKLGILNFIPAGADSCLNGTYPDIAADLMLPNGATIYAVVNFDGSLDAPFSFDDFPVSIFEECNYTNNLSSFALQLPAPPPLDLGPDIVLCADSTVVFDAGAGFYAYEWQDGSASAIFAASDPGIYWVEVTDSCGFRQRDSVLLTVSLLPDTQFPDTTVCAGTSVLYSVPGFDAYTWAPSAGLSCTDCADVTISPAATTTYTLLATTTDGCILEDTFVVAVLPLPTYTKTIEFCKGDTVFIDGTAYTQPVTVTDTIPAAAGCDTVATYILHYLTDPNSSVSIDCIEDINIATQAGTGPVAVDYDLPATAGDCPCPGIELALTEGLPSGSLFPITTTKVCYQATDSCGNTAKCCFNVTIREELPCDVKEIGCMKYELLDIKRNASTLNLTYRIRVTNNCANKMIYTAIQIPDGMVAVAPANNSIFTSEDGRAYDVRNPNYSPFYSIRFKSTNDSISGGNSDIFVYTLPPQADVDYIHVTSRLYPQIFYEAYLNTFNCPIEIVSDKPAYRDAGETHKRENPALSLFPNPTGGALFADLSEWSGKEVKIQVFDSRGQRVQHRIVTADAVPQEIELPKGLANGLYFFEVLTEDGEKHTARFVVQR